MSEAALPAPRGAGHWYAVAVLPHSDALAHEQLARQGFLVFAPTFKRTVRHARQFRTRVAPLFPGYMFVQLNLGQTRWRAVNGTRGVRGLVTAGERPARVPDAVIAALMAEAGEGAQVGLAPGAKLEIVAGPFAGLVARLEGLDGSARVAVLMEVIGSAPVTVSLPRNAVRVAA
jgi:transcription elongation factor/antiterminator RfaH